MKGTQKLTLIHVIIELKVYFYCFAVKIYNYVLIHSDMSADYIRMFKNKKLCNMLMKQVQI